MKARVWFHALGQSHEARHVPYILQRKAMQPWPLWAKQAYCAGRMSVPNAGADRVPVAKELFGAAVAQAADRLWRAPVARASGAGIHMVHIEWELVP